MDGYSEYTGIILFHGNDLVPAGNEDLTLEPFSCSRVLKSRIQPPTEEPTSTPKTRDSGQLKMSMLSLSTGLDTRILQYLTQPELSSISRTYKAYHVLAEPFLYKDPVFSEDQIFELMCFFLTILRRNKLVEYIRSFRFVKGRRTKVQLVQKHQRYQELELIMRSVKRLVKTFVP